MMYKFRLLYLVFIFLLSAVSCRKATFIGDELIPESDFLQSARSDTFTIITNTLPDDSIVTSFNLYYALGSLHDDTLGTTSADIYTQILLPTSNLTFGTNPVADSVVLMLDYAGLYGDSLAQHSVQVFKMLEDIETSTAYYSDAKLHFLPVEIGSSINFVPNVSDSVYIEDSVKTPAHLRIKLSDWFGQELFTSIGDRFVSNETFLEYLKGVYIKTDVSAGHSNSIMYFNMSSVYSGMKIYYHNDVNDSLSILFPFSGNKFNAFTHDYGSVVDNYIASPDTTAGDENVFVQGFSGLKTSVRFPYLDSLKNVSINKAEIVFTIDGAYDSVFAAPPSILLVRTDSTKRNVYDAISYSIELYHSLPDQSFNDPLNYGGRLDTLINIYGQSVLAYKYDISLYIQDIVLGKLKNDGLMLVCYPGNRIPNGVTLCGSNHPDITKRPYLSITYTLVDP